MAHIHHSLLPNASHTYVFRATTQHHTPGCYQTQTVGFAAPVVAATNALGTQHQQHQRHQQQHRQQQGCPTWGSRCFCCTECKFSTRGVGNLPPQELSFTHNTQTSGGLLMPTAMQLDSLSLSQESTLQRHSLGRDLPERLCKCTACTAHNRRWDSVRNQQLGVDDSWWFVECWQQHST